MKKKPCELGRAGQGRRRLLGAAAVATVAQAGFMRDARAGWVSRVLEFEARVDEAVQRAVVPAGARARHYTPADISAHFKSNGTHDPDDAQYQRLAGNGFADWRLAVDGLVDHPTSFSLAEIRAMPPVTQITRHDCVEGWSCIGQWTGVPLGRLLAGLGVQKQARYVMFFCYDKVSSAGGVGGIVENYYESIDLAEAFHPETILAYAMNGETLPIPHGAPLRLRLGRQLGYKMPKYLKRMTLVKDFRGIEGGRGGFYEDCGYAWYAGI
ncbi:MAG: molybdopterin-binding protein [Candidimonas sp.]|nr:MAG: molybdopterin-binding protein [Candidimonas sp.]